MTAPADTRISDAELDKRHESLTEQIRLLRIRLDKTAIPEDATQYSERLTEAQFKLALITELRERRAQAVTVTDEMVGRAITAFWNSITEIHVNGEIEGLDRGIRAALLAAPPQAAGVTESSVDHWQQTGHGPTPIERIAMIAKEAVMACRGEPEATDLRSVAGCVYDHVLVRMQEVLVQSAVLYRHPVYTGGEWFVTKSLQSSTPCEVVPLFALSAQDREEG